MLKLIYTSALCLLLFLPASAQAPATPVKPAVTPPAAPVTKPASSPAPAATPTAPPVTTANPSVPPPLGEPGETKSFEVRYADPEQLRAMFAGRSFVMEANRDLQVLTVHGTTAFLKEVEDTVKRFDVPPPPPANLQISVYLLTASAQAPSGTALPADLTAAGKEFSATGAPALVLADSQMMRLREGQPGEQASASSAPESASFSRIRLRSAAVIPGAKGEMISLTGLQIWFSIPAATAGAPAQTRPEPDVSADLDVDPNVPVVVSKAGVGKPVMVVLRAAIAK